MRSAIAAIPATPAPRVSTRIAETAGIASRNANSGILQSTGDAQALQRRHADVWKQLLEHPEQRAAYDIADAPLRPEPGSPVSVVIAIRTAAGIVSAELHIPRERFDAGLFFQALQETH